MLRKIAILLIFIYLIPNMGIGINLHWCGKHLASFSVNSITRLGCSCEELDELEPSVADEDGCCKEEFAFFKLNSTHVAVKEGIQIGAKLMLLFIFPDVNPELAANFHLPAFLLHSFDTKITDPPDQTQLCVFRV